jgi:hypothetical protein
MRFSFRESIHFVGEATMTEAMSRKRTGRKRIAGDRTPRGCLSRNLEKDIGAASPTAVARLVQEALRGCADEMFAAPLGRLFLEGKLSAAEFEAGKRWDRLSRRYYLAIGAPRPDPQIGSLSHAEKRKSDWTDLNLDSEIGQDRLRVDREIIEAFQAARAVVAEQGAAAERDMRRLCEGMGEFPAEFEALTRAKHALGNLAWFWGLESRRRRA